MKRVGWPIVVVLVAGACVLLGAGAAADSTTAPATAPATRPAKTYASLVELLTSAPKDMLPKIPSPDYDAKRRDLESWLAGETKGGKITLAVTRSYAYRIGIDTATGKGKYQVFSQAPKADPVPCSVNFTVEEDRGQQLNTLPRNMVYKVTGEIVHVHIMKGSSVEQPFDVEVFLKDVVFAR